MEFTRRRQKVGKLKAPSALNRRVLSLIMRRILCVRSPARVCLCIYMCAGGGPTADDKTHSLTHQPIDFHVQQCVSKATSGRRSFVLSRRRRLRAHKLRIFYCFLTNEFWLNMENSPGAGGKAYFAAQLNDDRWRTNSTAKVCRARLGCLFASQIGRKPAQKNSPSEKSKIQGTAHTQNLGGSKVFPPGAGDRMHVVCFALPRKKSGGDLI